MLSCSSHSQNRKMNKQLILPLKRKWFDQIKAGVKLEEYRLNNEYWQKRLQGKDYDEIVFTLGYPKKDDESRRLTFTYCGYRMKTIVSDEFGKEPVEVFAIQFSEIVSELDSMLAREGMI